MVVQMPKSIFQDKDYQNLRYFYRRAYYIAYIAAHVQKELGDSMDMTFELLHDNQLLPVLILRHREQVTEKDKHASKKGTKQKPYAIRIIPCATDDLFPFAKLTAAAGNIKTDETADTRTQITPFYNSTLNAEKTFIQYLRVLTNAKKECSAFAEACALGRIWLQQRGFESSISCGGFGSFEWAAITALLLKFGGRNGEAALSTSLSASELFKAVVQYLAAGEFIKKAVALGGSKVEPERIKETGPVLFDGVRQVNLLFKMNQSSALLLQLFAKSTTELLADEFADKFEPSFITKANVPLQAFDAVLNIVLPPTPSSTKATDCKGQLAHFAGEVHRVLKKAYGKRAVLVHTKLPQTSPWKLMGSHIETNNSITVGVVFDPANMSRQMEYGPSAEEQKEAAKFRQFWGEKAELRRFKSGSILECVEWKSRLPLQICEEIAGYSLGQHMKIPGSAISVYGEDLGNILNLSNTDKDAFDGVRQAFQKFETDVRNLADLPLHIRQLAPISAIGRYASVEAPLIGFHKEEIQPMDVNLYFEASNRWPENLVAIQEAKIEFLLDLDRRLTAAHENITTQLGRENRDIGIKNLAYLDVTYETGASYRLRIHCDLEETLLQRQVANNAIDGRIRENAEKALNEFQWLFNLRPLHTQTISTYCTRFHVLSPTIRLVKHWFDIHKLSGHFNEELVELIVLHIFVKPYPWPTPSSVTAGFLRTLFFLSRWDWRDEPLVVDTAEEMTLSDRQVVQAALDTARKRDPNMNHTVLFAATTSDTTGLAYTRSHPSKLIASRMTRLAKAAAKLVREQGEDLDASLLFETALQDYDFLLRLSPAAIRSSLRDAASEHGTRKQSQYKNLSAATGTIPASVRTRPVDVLAGELQRIFDDTLILFPSGAEEDNVVAGLWNPKLQRQKFRAGIPHNFHRVAGEVDDYVDVNRKAVLLEVARVAGSMIKHIQVNEDK